MVINKKLMIINKEEYAKWRALFYGLSITSITSKL